MEKIAIMAPHVDHQSRTCIPVRQEKNIVVYLAFDPTFGLRFRKSTAGNFVERFIKMLDYPIEKACYHYLDFALRVGATQEVLNCLKTKIKISKEEMTMAINKQKKIEAVNKSATKSNTTKKENTTMTKKIVKTTAAPATATVTASTTMVKKTAAAMSKPASKTNIKTVAKTATKKVAAKAVPASKSNTTGVPVTKAFASAKPAAKTVVKTGEKKLSASAMFQNLIMQGKLTDGEIFKAVQDKFNLDDGKRGYVGWYRNYLTKNGKNPPAPKK